MRISHKRLTIWKTTLAVLLPIYGHKCWKKSSKIGRPDWTTTEPAEVLPKPLSNVPAPVWHHMWFQKDEASSNYGKCVCDHLKRTFPNRSIEHGDLVVWPPRSPDLSPVDIFSLGYHEEPRERQVRQLRNGLLVTTIHLCCYHL
ncbi:hypothetical protein TNCV_3470401 [Trichonephila clavipes]|nr:hypothetical protein TNCV_3470401 [Trichonephila clavipes]